MAKIFDQNIKENDSFLDFTIPTETITDNLFEPSDKEKMTIDDMTLDKINYEELFKISDDGGTELILAKPATGQSETIVLNTKTISINGGPKQTKKFVTTQMNSAILAANQINNKYKKPKKKKKKRTVGKRNNGRSKKASTDWLKAAGYLDTKDQDAISCIYVPAEKADENKDIKSEVDNANLKKSDLTTKITANNILKKYNNLARKNPYKVSNISLTEPANAENIASTIETVDNIASLQPGKKCSVSSKKITGKYKKIRETTRKKDICFLLGEIVKAETVETPQRNVKVRAPMPKPSKNSTKNMKKYGKIRQEKAKKLSRIKGKEIVEEMVKKPESSSKSARIAARKISDKYREIKNKEDIDLVEEIREVVSKKMLKQLKKYLINTKR